MLNTMNLCFIIYGSIKLLCSLLGFVTITNNINSKLNLYSKSIKISKEGIALKLISHCHGLERDFV